MTEFKFGIVISTYRREDGSTPEVLKRALDSVFNQTYQNFKVFLVGDRYEGENEVLELLKNYDSNKISFVNLKEAKERDNHKEKSDPFSKQYFMPRYVDNFIRVQLLH